VSWGCVCRPSCVGWSPAGNTVVRVRPVVTWTQVTPHTTELSPVVAGSLVPHDVVCWVWPPSHQAPPHVLVGCSSRAVHCLRVVLLLLPFQHLVGGGNDTHHLMKHVAAMAPSRLHTSSAVLLLQLCQYAGVCARVCDTWVAPLAQRRARVSGGSAMPLTPCVGRCHLQQPEGVPCSSHCMLGQPPT
jgi:hypothetical protein